MSTRIPTLERPSISNSDMYIGATLGFIAAIAMAPTLTSAG